MGHERGASSPLCSSDGIPVDTYVHRTHCVQLATPAQPRQQLLSFGTTVSHKIWVKVMPIGTHLRVQPHCQGSSVCTGNPYIGGL